MKFNFNFDYDKLFLKEITILIPRYHNNLVSFLTPILGLYGINIKDFINDFESKAKFINFDVTIPAKVKITKIKTFEIFINTPYISSILNSLSVQKKSVNLLTVYKFVVLKSLVNNTLSITSFHKNIYTRLRIYLSKTFFLSDNLLLNKSKINNHLLGIINNTNLFFYNKLLNNLNNINFMLSFNSLKFGVFLVFYNHDASALNRLSSIAALFSIKLLKLKNKFLLPFFDNNLNFKGNIFFFGSKKFSDFSNFNASLNIGNSSNLFRSFFKIDKNIVNNSFFSVFNKSFFFKKDKIINLLQLLRLEFIRLLNYKFLLFFKIINKVNINANLPSNIS